MRRLRWSLALLSTAALVGVPLPAAAGGSGLRVDPEHATVLSLQQAMRGHRLSSVALTGYYLGRIRVLNPKLHAVIETNPDALREAAASDRYRRTHGARSALEGVPVLLKDNVDTADREQTTAGSYALVGSTPARDAHLVAKLRAGGAVVLGKANLSEWANFRSTSSSSGWSGRGGQTNNPYVLDRNPCGSSSGSAVAAAAQLAAVTIGTETDGSIVCPSGANDDVGIKPTLGLVSRAGVIPISAQQDTAGPITRNVTDAAAVLSVIQGVDPRDPGTAPAGPYVHRDYLRDLDARALKGKRIGVWREPAGTNADVNRVLDDSIATLRRLGATVVDNVVLPDQDTINNAEFPALLDEFKDDVNAYLAGRPGPHPADLAGLIAFDVAHADLEMPYFQQEIFDQAQATQGRADPQYAALRAAATGAARHSIDSTLATGRLDAILAPTNGPAWVTHLTGDDLTEFVGSSGPPAVAGYPNVTVPAGYSQGVLPLGVSFIGTRWSEPRLIAYAYAYEQATHARRPPRFLPTIGTAVAAPALVPAGVAAATR